MPDISINEAKAKIWIDDVNHELEQVESILKKVNASLTTTAGSGDSIMEGIYKVGMAMETAWTAMCNNFKSAQELIKNAVDVLGKTGVTIIDEAEALRNKVGS